MSRFFRSIQPLFKAIGTLSTPLCVSFSVASTVPSVDDAPDYVQDVFTQFDTSNIQIPKQEPLNAPHTKSLQFEAISKPQPQQSSVNASAQASGIYIEPEKEVPLATFNQYLSRFIDHTVLKPLSSEDDIRKMCAEAKKHNFFSVCCNPCWVSLCSELLKDTPVKICCVVGFPLGSNTTHIKVLEAQKAVEDGADEIDMVMNIGNAKSGNWDFVFEDIKMVVLTVPEEVKVKVILETCLLTDEEIIAACKCVVHAGAHFVKTSTGFGGGGATTHHVRLMRQTVDKEAVKLGKEIGSVLVKASGGIRDSQTAKDMMRAGADRIGASSGIKIIKNDENTAVNTSKINTQEQY